MDINRTAPAIVELGTVVRAPLTRIWDLHTDIERWPTWNPGIEAATQPGPFTPGTVFEWETAGLQVASTIYEVEPRHRTLWGGPALGIEGIHLWTFTEHPDGVHIHTAESWDGEPVHADLTNLTAALRASLVAWLKALKTAATS